MDDTTQLTVYLFFLANIIYCTAYVIRDILWLRILTVIAAVSTFPYFIFQSEVLYSALAWQAAFALINIVNIAYLLRERKPVPMTEEQHRLQSLVFRDMNSRDVVRLVDVGEWREAATGDVLIREGEYIDSLYLVYSGLLVATSDGEFKRHIRDGEFVGELSYILQQQTTANVVVVKQTRYLSWNRSKLEAFLRKRPAVEANFRNLLSYDVAGKLAWERRLMDEDTADQVKN